MNGHDMTGHDALLARLGYIADQLDPVPDLTYRMAYAGFQLRSIDSELAELIEDSALHDDALAGVRGDDARLLYYQASELGIELEVTSHAGRHAVLGQVVGGTAWEVRAETAVGVQPVTVDDLGRFSLANLPAGPFRVRVTSPDRPPVTTNWVTL
jgi:hypothetical protein